MKFSLLIVLTIALTSITASAAVVDYRDSVLANPSAFAMYSFEGDSAATRQADGVGSNDLITVTQGNGNAASIAYGTGFDATTQAVTPHHINDDNGAAFFTGSAVNMPSSVSFEAIVRTRGLPDNDYGYVAGTRSSTNQRNYFAMQVGEPGTSDDLVNVSGNSFTGNRNTIISNYDTTDWYYIAVTLEITGSNTRVNTWAANLSDGETTLTQVASNAIEGGTFVNNYVLGIGILNNIGVPNQALHGDIDEIALYDGLFTEADFQNNLDLIYVPEPATMGLLGAVGLMVMRRKAGCTLR